MIRQRFHALTVPIFFLIAAALWLVPLVPNPGDIVFWRGAEYSDLLITHWPNAYFLKGAIEKWGEIPLWNPRVLSGAPFVADPLSGVWYPPNWFTLVIPIQLAFNLLFWLHLAWTGWGMYRWMRLVGLGNLGAIVAGVAWSGTPKWIAHIGLGHLSLVMAVSWTPWVLFLAERTLKEVEVDGRRWLRWAALTGAVFGLVFLADPRWSLPLGMLGFVYVLRRISYSRSTDRIEGGKREEIRRFGRVGMVVALFAVGLAAGLGLPLVEYVRQSTRAGLSSQDLMTLSMPLKYLLGIVIPFSGQPEWLAYAGVSVLFLALVTLLRKRKGAWFWSSIVLVSWVLALGEFTPLYGLLTKLLPGANLLRVPPRALFLGLLGLAVLAGVGIETILNLEWSSAERRKARLATVAYSTLVFLISIGVWLLSTDRPLILWGVAGLALLVILWFLVTQMGRIPVRIINIGWILLIGVELLCVNSQLLETFPAEEKLNERFEHIRAFADRVGFGRTFSPSYSLPQQSAARAGLQLADGVNPLQLDRTWDFMAAAVGFQPEAYSVTLPPYPNGDPRRPGSFELNASLLGRLSIRFVVADYPIDAENLILEYKRGELQVYRNEAAMPRAWIQTGEGSGDWRRVDTLDWTPNRIAINTAGPGLLVLSEIDYPGWRARLDGNPLEIHTVDGLLRGVTLPEGDHRVEFIFQPFWVYIGSAISLITCILLVVLWMRR